MTLLASLFISQILKCFHLAYMFSPDMNRTWDGSYEVFVFVSAIMGNFLPKLVDF